MKMLAISQCVARLSWAAVVALAACSQADSAPRSTLSAEEAATQRQACTFAAGTLPGFSLAKDAPLGKQIPIDHVVVLMMENRSFDHLLGDLHATQPDADAMPADASNPDADGNPVAAHHLTQYCFDDTDHSWDGTRLQYGGGKNDGFVKSNVGAPGDPTGARAMGYYTAADAPFVYWAASEFALGDRYFSALLGPTFPNRLFLYAATSFGYIDNKIIGDQTQNIMEVLESGKVGWQVYSESIPGMGVLIRSTSKYLNKHFNKLPAFYEAAAAGKLDQVTFLDPDLAETQGAGADDFHPPGNVQLGDQLLSKVVDALVHSPDWAHTALFITFDEHGGLYDHVAPPMACAPDGILPMVSGEATPATPGFDRLGFRVPLIVVSPYAKRHYVSHEVYDHTSILRFLEARFGLPAMTARDANAAPLFDLFDFHHAVTTVSTAPVVSIDAAEQARCAAAFPPKQE